MDVDSLRRIVRPRSWFKGPAAKLAALVTQAHAGEISIEEMRASPAAGGKLTELATVMGNVLLDLKQQRAELAGLEQEMRDRLANRTDALERKIGSLQVQASRDALTGLGNRCGLDADLPGIIAAYREAGTDTCVLMIDVDHFKQLNDTLGHPAGDQLLREIGQLIRSSLRGNDRAYRCGGDEFVVLLHHSDSVAGRAIASRLMSLVKSLTAQMALRLPPQLSIGIAAVSELKDPAPELLMKTADSRLYAVKAARPGSRRTA